MVQRFFFFFTARGERERAHETGSLAKYRCPMTRDPVHSHVCSVAAHTSFRTAVQGCSSLLARNRYSSGGWAGAMQHTLKRNKEVHTKPSTGKDMPKRGELSSTGCEGPSCLCKEVFQGPGHSHAAVQGWSKLQRAAFPNTAKQRTAPRSLT